MKKLKEAIAKSKINEQTGELTAQEAKNVTSIAKEIGQQARLLAGHAKKKDTISASRTLELIKGKVEDGKRFTG